MTANSYGAALNILGKTNTPGSGLMGVTRA